MLLDFRQIDLIRACNGLALRSGPVLGLLCTALALNLFSLDGFASAPLCPGVVDGVASPFPLDGTFRESRTPDGRVWSGSIGGQMAQLTSLDRQQFPAGPVDRREIRGRWLGGPVEVRVTEAQAGGPRVVEGLLWENRIRLIASAALDGRADLSGVVKPVFGRSIGNLTSDVEARPVPGRSGTRRVAGRVGELVIDLTDTILDDESVEVSGRFGAWSGKVRLRPGVASARLGFLMEGLFGAVLPETPTDVETQRSARLRSDVRPDLVWYALLALRQSALENRLRFRTGRLPGFGYGPNSQTATGALGFFD